MKRVSTDLCLIRDPRARAEHPCPLRNNWPEWHPPIAKARDLRKNSPIVAQSDQLGVFAKTPKGFRNRRIQHFRGALVVHAARMDRAGSSPEGDADQEIVTVCTNSPRTRRTKRSTSASRLSSGRRGPKAVNFKSPPRAVFKSSAAARQACGPGTVICIPVRYYRPSPRVAGCRHMPASERQGRLGTRGGFEPLPEIRADRYRRTSR